MSEEIFLGVSVICLIVRGIYTTTKIQVKAVVLKIFAVKRFLSSVVCLKVSGLNYILNEVIEKELHG